MGCLTHDHSMEEVGYYDLGCDLHGIAFKTHDLMQSSQLWDISRVAIVICISSMRGVKCREVR